MSVQNVIQRTRGLQRGQTLGAKEKVLSSNTVTGISLNVPISGTCKPTKVCSQTCYAAKPTPIALPAALEKQLRVYNSIIQNPSEVSGRIIAEMIGHMRRGAKFLRWNGVGDLFEESITCMVEVADALPQLPIWCVTRKPEMAAVVPQRDNIFVHFSLDSSSLYRHGHLMSLSPISSNIFFSYQETEGESSQPEGLVDVPISVYFTDMYSKPAPMRYAAASCPLNNLSDPAGACVSCGRCWNGDAMGVPSLGPDQVVGEAVDAGQIDIKRD
jgi:hypothetical protein